MISASSLAISHSDFSTACSPKGKLPKYLVSGACLLQTGGRHGSHSHSEPRPHPMKAGPLLLDYVGFMKEFYINIGPFERSLLCTIAFVLQACCFKIVPGFSESHFGGRASYMDENSPIPQVLYTCKVCYEALACKGAPGPVTSFSFAYILQSSFRR
jgi:hypothetical protein